MVSLAGCTCGSASWFLAHLDHVGCSAHLLHICSSYWGWKVQERSLTTFYILAYPRVAHKKELSLSMEDGWSIVWCEHLSFTWCPSNFVSWGLQTPWHRHTYRRLTEIPNWPFVEVPESTTVSRPPIILSISLSVFLGSRLDCPSLPRLGPRAPMQALVTLFHLHVVHIPGCSHLLLVWSRRCVESLFRSVFLLGGHSFHITFISTKTAPYCLSYRLSVPTVHQCQPIQLFLSDLYVRFNSTDCTLNWQDLSIWWDPSAHLLEHWIASSISNIPYVSSPLQEYCLRLSI